MIVYHFKGVRLASNYKFNIGVGGVSEFFSTGIERNYIWLFTHLKVLGYYKFNIGVGGVSEFFFV